MDVPDAWAVDGDFAFANPVVRNATVPLFHPDAEFHPGQVGAQAAMRAGTESNVTVARPFKIDVVGCFEFGGINISCAE